MSDKTIIAIDPGVHGSAFILGGYPLFMTPSKVLWAARSAERQGVDLAASTHAVIEDVHASPVMGTAGAFAFGKNFGEWLGLLHALGIPTWAVRPQVWQYDLGLTSRGAERKKDLRLLCKKRHPAMHVTADNCDAILISDWALKNDYTKQRKIL